MMLMDSVHVAHPQSAKQTDSSLGNNLNHPYITELLDHLCPMKQKSPMTVESKLERQSWWGKTSPPSGNSCRGLDTELISPR